MLAGEPGVRQRLGVAVPDHPGGLLEFHAVELRGHLQRLGLGRLARLHGVDRLQHDGDPRAPGLRHPRQNVSVEVDRAALVGGLREDLGDRPHHAGGLVAREHADPAQAARPQPGEEPPPALRGLREALGRAYDLAVAVVVDTYRHHHGHLLVGASPAALEVDPVHVDVGVRPLEGPVPPRLHGLERLLVEVGDGGGRDARPPEDLGDVLDAPGRDAGEVHLYHGLLDAGLPAPVTLDDRRREAHPLELWHADRDLAGRRRELALVMAGAVRLAVGGPLVALRADQVVGLLVQEAVEHLLDGPPDELAQVGPQRLLVQRYNGIGHGLPPICFLSRQLESYRGGPCPPFLPGRYSAVKVRKKLYVTLATTSGEVAIHMPKLKGMKFTTTIIERYRRRETNVDEAMIEMYLAGVSTRRIADTVDFHAARTARHRVDIFNNIISRIPRDTSFRTLTRADPKIDSSCNGVAMDTVQPGLDTLEDVISMDSRGSTIKPTRGTDQSDNRHRKIADFRYQKGPLLNLIRF